MPSEVTSQTAGKSNGRCVGGGRGRMLVWVRYDMKGREGKIDHPASYTR
jgi:hypothetical protein